MLTLNDIGFSNKKFFNKFDEDDRLVSYHPIKSIEIFNYKVDPSNCIINISKKLRWLEVSNILANYLEWLAICESQLTDYFHLQLKENLPEGWFENIEVYSADITFLALDDFGATISFGEGIFPDHAIELEFEQFEIVSERLNG